MAPSTQRPTDGDLVWYFAYGSNLSREKFVGGRGIVPRESARVRTPGWILALDIPGLPYQEPTFTSVVPRPTPAPTGRLFRGQEITGAEKDRPVAPGPRGTGEVEYRDAIGVAYLITVAQYRKVIGSEGGGTAYRDVEIQAEPLEESDRKRVGDDHILVRTLTSAIQRVPWPKPSQRYMDLILTGAREAQLPLDYQAFLRSIGTYQKPNHKRGKVGATIFLGLWDPVMGLMEKITTATIGSDGYAPYSVILLVRFVMFIIWLTHDAFFAPIFGRGDGHASSSWIEERPLDGNEKSPLIPRYENMPELAV